jgi:predicted MFS family arabinose efflux permease
MVDSASWRLVFAINVLPIALVLWLMRKLTADEKIKPGTHVDWIGAGLCILGLGLPVYALIEQPHYGWNSPLIYATLAAGLLAFGAFIMSEKRSSHPMLPLALFKVRNFGVGNIATTSIYAGLSSLTFLLAIFLQQVVGYKATVAGVALLPITIMMFFLSSRFGALAGKYGPRFFMAAGPIVGGIGALLFVRLGAHAHYVTELLPGIIIFGLGLSMTVAPLTAAILGSIDSRQAGIGSAINNAVARIAGLVAIATVGLLAGKNLGLAGFHKGIVLTVILLILGGIISAIGIQNHPQKSLQKDALT